VGRQVVGTAAARAAVRQYLTVFAILVIDSQALLDATAVAGGDVEDNIPIAAAVTAALDALVTRHVADFSPLPASRVGPG
jgi:hypothetical protein